MVKEIKGENERYKREILREERGDFWHLEILRNEEKKNQRERWDSKLGNLEFLKQRMKILHSKELTHSKTPLRAKLEAH